MLILLVTGCGGPRIYRANKVPPQYLAPTVQNVHTIDFSKLASHAAASNQIGPGDLLEITIEAGYSGQVETVPVRVADDGNASLPLIGKLPLAGYEPEVAEGVIAAAAVERGLYKNPTVVVNMKRQRTHRVTVIGAVEAPDVYELPAGSSSLLSALVAAGGLSSNAATTVEIRRPAAIDLARRPPQNGVTPAGYHQPATQPTSLKVDLVEAAREDRPAQQLADGDIVMVQKRDLQPFDVMGLVMKPGRFEMPANKDVYLLDAIAMAGGPTSAWADKVHLIRHGEGESKPVVIEISIKEAKQHGQGNLRMAPGDVLAVEQTPTTFVTGVFRAVAPYSVSALVPFIR